MKASGRTRVLILSILFALLLAIPVAAKSAGGSSSGTAGKGARGATVGGGGKSATRMLRGRVTGGAGGANSIVGDEPFLVVEATPSAAEVFLDGRSLGSAGQLLARAQPLARGRHTVAVIAKGFRPYVTRFVTDSTLVVRAVLVPE